MAEDIDVLSEDVRKMNAAVNVYSDILKTSGKNDGENENNKIKLGIMRDEILQANMRIKKQINKMLTLIERDARD